MHPIQKGRHMQGDPYQVAISFCDGQVFVHEYLETADAIKDYAGALQEAFEPTLGDQITTDEGLTPVPDRRHVRQVSLMKYDEEGALVRHIDSGVMNDDCSHRKIDTKGTL